MMKTAYQKIITGLTVVFLDAVAESEWEDIPLKPGFGIAHKFKLETAVGTRPDTLSGCKALCDSQPGCVALVFEPSNGNLCLGFDTDVPDQYLEKRYFPTTFSRKIKVAGKSYIWCISM